MKDAKLLHYSHCVSDIERSRRFYTEVLGFEVMAEFDFDDERTAQVMMVPGARFKGIFMKRDGMRIDWDAPIDHPEEVEDAVCQRIEESLQDLEGVDEMTSIAAEGMGTVVIELDNDTDVRVALDDGMRIEIIGFENPPPDATVRPRMANEVGHSHFTFNVKDLDATLAELAGHGIEPEPGSRQMLHETIECCVVRDPDGFPIELVSSPDLHLLPYEA